MILEHKLPTILTVDEIDRLLEAVDDIKYKAMFATMYSSGMRVSEVIHLHYDDISRSNMQIHVRDTKNRMDRYTFFLNGVWISLHNTGLKRASPWNPVSINLPNYLTVSTLEQVMRRAVSDAELPKVTPLSPSQLCNSSDGAGRRRQPNIQALLGHRDPNPRKFIFMSATNPFWESKVHLTGKKVLIYDQATVQGYFPVSLSGIP